MMQRLSGDFSKGGSSSRQGNSNNNRSGSTVRTIRHEKQGTMREISFVPKGDSKGGDGGYGKSKRRDTREPKKGSRLDRERAHFIG